MTHAKPVIAFLPCRKGSQRVIEKNTRPFAGAELHGEIDLVLLEIDRRDRVADVRELDEFGETIAAGVVHDFGDGEEFLVGGRLAGVGGGGADGAGGIDEGEGFAEIGEIALVGTGDGETFAGFRADGAGFEARAGGTAESLLMVLMRWTTHEERTRCISWEVVVAAKMEAAVLPVTAVWFFHAAAGYLA